MKLKFNDEIAQAFESKLPIVALESTVIAHGLPSPQNLETAKHLETIVRDSGAIPATIAVFHGEICVGLTQSQLTQLANDKSFRKLSVRDLPIAISTELNGATTVATTSLIAHRAGIKVFATGGIGGVHRGYAQDVSADLPVLASTPIVVVCAGAKSILDLPATREWLETYGICVVGFRCDEFPAFYCEKSGMSVDVRIENAKEAAEISVARNELGMNQCVLVVAPIEKEFAMDAVEFEKLLNESLSYADQKEIKGKALTPFLLSRLAELSGGKTLSANLALLENNVRIAAQIAVALKD